MHLAMSKEPELPIIDFNSVPGFVLTCCCSFLSLPKHLHSLTVIASLCVLQIFRMCITVIGSSDADRSNFFCKNLCRYRSIQTLFQE